MRATSRATGCCFRCFRSTKAGGVFFGIACNFLGLQEFSHAHDSLESYLTLDPDGEFVADALDMLDVIEDEGMLYSCPAYSRRRSATRSTPARRGRQLLETDV